MSIEQLYIELLPQIESLLLDETDVIANMANITAALQSTFNHHWIGFYLVKNNQLVLGPFQGPVACTRIDFGKGVCGAAWMNKKNYNVPNVHLFKGHIACSPYSISEIVIPIFNSQMEVWAVLDIDSIYENSFNEIDEKYLGRICKLINN